MPSLSQRSMDVSFKPRARHWGQRWHWSSCLRHLSSCSRRKISLPPCSFDDGLRSLGPRSLSHFPGDEYAPWLYKCPKSWPLDPWFWDLGHCAGYFGGLGKQADYGMVALDVSRSGLQSALTNADTRPLIEGYTLTRIRDPRSPKAYSLSQRVLGALGMYFDSKWPPSFCLI